MKKYLARLSVLALLIPAHLCLCGYEQPDKYYLDKLPPHEVSVVVIKTSYPEAFKATVNIFRDLNIVILRKDMPGNKIIGRGNNTVGSFSIYAAFFDDNGKGDIKISIKIRGGWWNGDYIIDKIKDEIELQKKLP